MLSQALDQVFRYCQEYIIYRECELGNMLKVDREWVCD